MAQAYEIHAAVSYADAKKLARDTMVVVRMLPDPDLFQPNYWAMPRQAMVHGGLAMREIVAEWDGLEEAIPFSREELTVAFHSVCDAKDWKGPIVTLQDSENVPVTVEAIKFFTGTAPTCKPIANNKILIKSPGYRDGPCGG